MHVALAIAAFSVVGIVSTNAHAQDPTKKQCIEANAAAQKEQKEGKLRAAMSSLDLCNHPSCPGAVRDDCTQRLNDLMSRIPTLVFEVHDPRGQDVTAVRLFVDGQPFAEKLDGTALAVDPGEHTFRFESPRFLPVTTKLVIREGDHARREPVKFAKYTNPPPVVTPPVPAAGGPPPPPPPPPPPEPVTTTTHPLRTLGIVTASAGVVGIGLGIGLAIRAQSRLEDSKVDPDGNGCNAQDVCGAQGKALRGDAQLASTVSTIGFIGGGVLVATGVGLILFGPTETTTASPSAKLTPMMGPGTGGAVLSGTF